MLEAYIYENGLKIVDIEDNENGFGVNITTSNGIKYIGCYPVDINDSGIDRDPEWIGYGPISISIKFAWKHDTQENTSWEWNQLKSLY